ncbi:MAG: transposase [Anaerolineae bacterium]|nr:transposase [Anaerolineae bacterium]
MDNKELLDLYSDYLISAFGQTTGTGLSELLGGTVSHDRIQRFLSQNEFTASDLWHIVKPHIRAIQRDDGVMIVDDSIAEKPYTDENDIICWHYDHAQDRQVKGINFLSAVYHVQDITLPVGFRLVAKTEYYVDKKDGKTKRRSPVSKNEHYQALLRQAKQNHIPFQFVLNDVWYASADNMRFVKQDLETDFIMPLKSNRKVALSAADKQQGRYLRVDNLTLEAGVVREVYLEGIDFPLALVKQVFANEDGSSGIQYLVCSQTTLTGDAIIDLYRKRWTVEPFHKSLKQNASLEKSPTRTVRTQTNHLFASFCGYIKLELLKISTKLNHFAFKSQLYLRALQAAFAALRHSYPVRLAA